MGYLYCLEHAVHNGHPRNWIDLRHLRESGGYACLGHVSYILLEKGALLFSAEVVGAILGAGLGHLLYSPVMVHFNSTEYLACAYGGVSGVSFAHPGATITPIRAFGDQIILAAFLIFGIFAITEQYSKMALQTSRNLAPSFSTEILVQSGCPRLVENL